MTKPPTLATEERQAHDSEQPSSGPRELLRLDGLRKQFGDFAAVAGVTISITEGEIVTLLGPSGCGKTTILRMIAGLEEPTRGTIEYQGRILAAEGTRTVPPNRRSMGMVFQNYALWPHLTVHQNVAYPLRIRRRPKNEIQEAVERTLGLVDMSGMATRRVTELSGGQQQRVALARAVIMEPPLLLLDEPFSNLDANLRTELRTEIKHLQKRLGLAMLFVTHDQTEALSISDRIVMMHQGKIEQVGTCKEMYRAPRTRLVRDFLGHSLVMRGILTKRESEQVTVALAGCHDVTLLSTQTPKGDIQESEPVELSMRQEAVQLEKDGGQGRPVNAVGGRVLTTLYLGDRQEVEIALESGESVLLSPPGASIKEDDKVWLITDPTEVTVWKSSPTETHAKAPQEAGSS